MPRWFENLMNEWARAFTYLDPESFAVMLDTVKHGAHDYHGGNEL